MGTARAPRGQAVRAAGAGQTSVGESTFGGQIPAAATAGALHPEAGEGHSPDAVVMVRRATEVLGIEHVGQWMRSRIPSLDNQTPYALMQTAGGRERVERVLLKIEHGVY